MPMPSPTRPKPNPYRMRSSNDVNPLTFSIADELDQFPSAEPMIASDSRNVAITGNITRPRIMLIAPYITSFAFSFAMLIYGITF